jgi:hypothetical protein
MRQYLIFILFFILAAPVWAKWKERHLGVVLGNPTGISGKLMKNSLKGIDGVVGFSIGRHTEVSIHSDYLFYSPEFIYLQETYPVDLYYGIGGRMEFSDTIQLGPRLPLGLQYNYSEKNAELFVEIAPIVDLLGTFGLEVNLSLGARYQF